MRYVIFGVIGVIGVIMLGLGKSLYSYLSYSKGINEGVSALSDIDKSRYAHDESFSFKNIYNQGLILAKEGKYDEARNLFSSLLKEDTPSSIRSSTLEILGDIEALEGEKQDIEKQLLLLSGALKQYKGSLAIAKNKRIEQKINLIRAIYEKNETKNRLREGDPIPSNAEQGKTSKRPPSKQEIETIGETRRTLGIYDAEREKYLQYTPKDQEASPEESLWQDLDAGNPTSMREDW